MLATRSRGARFTRGTTASGTAVRRRSFQRFRVASKNSNMKISKVVIVINRTKPHARQTASALKAFLDRERVRQQWVETLPPQKDLKMADLRDRKGDRVIAVGGDGTL